MKKYVVLTILICLFLLPLRVSARSVAQYRQDLQNMKNKQAEIQANSAAIQKEIDAANAKIASLKKEAEEAVQEEEKTKQEIEELEKKIVVKREQIKSLIAFHQISNGENFYLEY